MLRGANPDLVITDLDGQPVDLRNILRNQVEPVARAGIKRNVMLHGLMYSFTTHSTNRTRVAKLTSRVTPQGTRG